MAVDAATAVMPAPSLDQGDTMVSPNPEPTISRMTVTVDAAKAPARIGPQRNADVLDSTAGLTRSSAI